MKKKLAVVLLIVIAAIELFACNDSDRNPDDLVKAEAAFVCCQ